MSDPSASSSTSTSSDDEFAVYRWQPLPDAPQTFARSCWGGERFFHQYSRWTKGHADAIGIMTASVPNVSHDQLRELVVAAHVWARFQAPLIGATVECGVLPGLEPWLGAWVYRSSSDSKLAEEWARRSIFFYTVSPSQTLAERVEEVRVERTLDAATSECPLTVHFVVGNDGEHTMLQHGTHYIFDGQSNLSLIELELSFWARWAHDVEGGWREVRSLKWGEEVARLPRALPESIGLPFDDCHDDEQAQKIIGPELAGHGPSLGLPPQHLEPSGELGHAFHSRRILSPEISASFNRACRALGFTSGHGLDAARHIAVWALRSQDAAAAGEELEETHIINFMLPIDFRRYFKSEYLGKPYICTGTAGFTTEVDLQLIAPKDGETMGEKAWLLRAWKDVGPELAKQYNAVANDRDIIKGMGPVTDMLGVSNEDWPPFEMINPGDAYTSLGKLESRLRTNYAADGGANGAPVVQILDWFNTSRLTRPQMGLHTWLFGGRIHLNTNHSAHYERAYIARYVDVVEQLIVHAAETYGGASKSNAPSKTGEGLEPVQKMRDAKL